MNQLISVIIPVYNVELFLVECLETVIRQSYTNLEMILVDDGSTDSSGKICDDFAKRDARIKVIHQENRGLSGARNTGIRAAKGEYLVFVDSDDRIHPMMIQILYYGMLQYSAELTICSHRIIRENEPLKDSFINEEEIEKGELLSGKECLKRMYKNQPIDMIVAWNKLYKREQFSGLYYPEGKVHEDEFLTYQILYPLERCLYFPVPLYEYRVRKNSIMDKNNLQKQKDKVQAYGERCDYFREKCDLRLYVEALRRYETAVAELIIHLNSYGEKILAKKYYHLFWDTYIREIWPSDMEIRHKLKYMLFLINKRLYKKLKIWDQENKGR